MKKLSITYALMMLLSFATPVFAHVAGEGYPTRSWPMWWGYGTGWWIFPLIMFFIMIFFCFFFFFVFMRRGWRAPWCGFGEHKDAETPLDILKKRYAKGEIDKEEFEAMKKDI